MPEKTCLGCGGWTNTAVCDYLDHVDWKPRKCFARWEDDQWVKGCGYDDLPLDSLERRFVDRLLLEAASAEAVEGSAAAIQGDHLSDD